MPEPTFQEFPAAPWTRTDWEEFQATATDEQRALVAFPAEFLKLLGVIGRHPGGEPDKGLFGYTYRQHRYNPANPVHQAEIDLFPTFDPVGSFHFEDGTWCSEGYMLPTPKPEDLVGDISQAIAKGIVVWRPEIASPEPTTEVAGEGSEAHPYQPDAPAPGSTAYSGEFPPAEPQEEQPFRFLRQHVEAKGEAVLGLFETAGEYKAQIRSLQSLGVTTSTVDAVRDDLALKLGLELLNLE